MYIYIYISCHFSAKLGCQENKNIITLRARGVSWADMMTWFGGSGVPVGTVSSVQQTDDIIWDYHKWIL